jgi:hypothetical protein
MEISKIVNKLVTNKKFGKKIRRKMKAARYKGRGSKEAKYLRKLFAESIEDARNKRFDKVAMLGTLSVSTNNCLTTTTTTTTYTNTRTTGPLTRTLSTPAPV